MVYDYLITFKKPDFKLVDRLSQLLYLIAFSTFIYLGLKTILVVTYLIYAILLLAIFIFLQVKRKRRGVVYYTPGFALIALVFLTGPAGNLLISAFFLLCLLLEREFKFHKELGFSATEIVFNTLVKKRHQWAEFNNILIKDGLITLDFKDNRVIQKEIEGYVEPAIEAEFNSYCRSHLQKTS